MLGFGSHRTKDHSGKPGPTPAAVLLFASLVLPTHAGVPLLVCDSHKKLSFQPGPNPTSQLQTAGQLWCHHQHCALLSSAQHENCGPAQARKTGIKNQTKPTTTNSQTVSGHFQQKINMSPATAARSSTANSTLTTSMCCHPTPVKPRGAPSYFPGSVVQNT